MLRFALTASIAVLAALPWPHTAGLAAQEAVLPMQRSVDTAVMKVKPTPAGAFVLAWDSSAVACDGRTVAAAEWIAPHSLFAARKLLDFPVTVGFSIADDGRAVDIRVIEGGYVEGKLQTSIDPGSRTVRVNTKGLLESLALRDLMPSLRASRFAAAAPQSDCTVTYTPQYAEADRIGREALAAVGAVPGMVMNAENRDRLGGGDCNTVGWPAPMVRTFPDWRVIGQRPGARKWSWIAFDLDDEGAPVNVRMIASTGHDDLDEEGLRAIRETRFTEGPRTACVTAWWSNPATIPAPPAPDNREFANYRSCTGLRSWATKPRLTFPQAYNERSIEGWAVLGFDIGPDGAIGNIGVLAAQPSEEFGVAGAAVLRSGRFQASEDTHTRCIERVRFAIDKPATTAADD